MSSSQPRPKSTKQESIRQHKGKQNHVVQASQEKVKSKPICPPLSIQEFLHLNEINEENDQEPNNHIHLQPHPTQRTTREAFGECNQSSSHCQIGSSPLKKRVKRNIFHFDVETQIVAN